MTPLQLSLLEQTHIRRRLLSQGYSPVPTYGKAVYVKGWTSMTIDEAAIRSWENVARHRGTGLRLDNGLVVIDCDIEHEAATTDLVFETMAEFIPNLPSALVRGKDTGFKEAWVMRLPDGARAFGRHVTTAHVLPGEDPEDENRSTHFVEVYGGGSGRHFSCWGPHSFDDRGDVVQNYRWLTDDTPLTVPLRDLPVVTEAQIAEAIVAVNSLLSTHLKWPRVLRHRAGKTDLDHAYTLTDDMIFHCADGVSRSYRELDVYAATAHSPRCSASWLEGPQSTNRSRVLIHMHPETGEVTLFETSSYTRYHHEDNRPRTMSESHARLREKMAEAGYRMHELHPDAPDPFVKAVEELHLNWAYDESRARQCLPIYAPEERSAVLGNLRLKYAPAAYEKEGPRGGVIKVNPVDVWVQSPVRIGDLDGYRFLPDQPRGIVEYKGQKVINSYTPIPRNHGRNVAVENVFRRFIEHLIPHPEEREWLLDWMAHKVQHPEIPGVAVLNYTPVYGTGRGTLGDIFAGVLGRQYTSTITAAQLLGEGSQSQYNDWLHGKLLVLIEEVLQGGEDGASMGWRRKRDYEKAKEHLDPRPRDILVVRKGLPNTQSHIVASFLMATNHENALPLEIEDRRIVVLRGPHTPLRENEELYQDLFSYTGSDASFTDEFCDAVYWMLADRDVSGFAPHVAPDWGGKVDMNEENRTELDELFEEVLAGWPHDWAERLAFIDITSKTAERRGLLAEYRSVRRAASDWLRTRSGWRKGSRRLPLGPDGKVQKTVFYRTKEEAARVDDLSISERIREWHDQQNGAEPSAEVLAKRKGLHVVGNR